MGRWIVAALLLMTASVASAEPISERYAPGARGELDIYRPAGASNTPVVIYLYGGAWQFGEKARAASVGAALAAQGFVTVIPDYRVFPEVRFPGFIEDAAAAIAWTQDHISAHGGDPTRIVLMGHSAGAHIAALVALDERYAAQAGFDRTAVRGVIGLSGPYYHPSEFRDQRLCEIFCSAAAWSDVEPMHFLSADDPPLLLIVGDQDTAVPPLAPIAEAARTVGANVETKTYAGVDHGGTVRAFTDPAIAPTLEDVEAFVRRVTE